jgi:hypothetical protein
MMRGGSRRRRAAAAWAAANSGSERNDRQVRHTARRRQSSLAGRRRKISYMVSTGRSAALEAARSGAARPSSPAHSSSDATIPETAHTDTHKEKLVPSLLDKPWRSYVVNCLPPKPGKETRSRACREVYLRRREERRAGDTVARGRSPFEETRRGGEFGRFFLAGYDRGVVQFVMDSLSTTTLSD